MNAPKTPIDNSPPELQQAADSGATNSNNAHGRVSKFNRLVITWFVFTPLTFPFMDGDFWSCGVQASGSALGIALIAWVVTVVMKPTRTALVSTIGLALVLYVMSMAGRFIGRNAERSISSVPASTQPAIPISVRESLEKTARQINSQAPMRVDKYSVLNSTSFSGRSVIYRYTLEVELSDQEFRELLREIRPLTVGNFRRNSSDARSFARYGINVFYQYTEKGGKVMNLELDFAKDSDLDWARK